MPANSRTCSRSASQAPSDATALGKVKNLIAIATHDGPFAQAAKVLLPAASWAEAEGTFVNRHGLAQEERARRETARRFASGLPLGARAQTRARPAAALAETRRAPRRHDSEKRRAARSDGSTPVTFIDVLLIIIKVVVVVLVMMHLAIFLTWADRRQGAMIQDRIGPNRAVIWLPTRMAQGAAVVPALGVAALVALLAFGHLAGLWKAPEGPSRTSAAMLFSQLAIFLTWATGAMISGKVASRGPRSSFDLWIQGFAPRTIIYLGLAAHLGTLLVGSAFRGTEQGLVLRDVGLRCRGGALDLRDPVRRRVTPRTASAMNLASAFARSGSCTPQPTA